MRYNFILCVEDDDLGTVDPASYVFTTTSGDTHPEIVISWTALENSPEDHRDVWEELDLGKFANFPGIERRLRELRPERPYNVTVVFTVTATDEDDANEKVEGFIRCSRYGSEDESYYIESTDEA